MASAPLFQKNKTSFNIVSIKFGKLAIEIQT